MYYLLFYKQNGIQRYKIQGAYITQKGDSSLNSTNVSFGRLVPLSLFF